MMRTYFGYNDWDGMSVTLAQFDTVRDGRTPLIPECGRFVSGRMSPDG